MKGTSINTSSEVTRFDNNVMATINKLKNQHKRVDLVNIYKELTKNLELNNFTEDRLKSRINAPLVSGEIINKSNRDYPLHLLNGTTSPITTQTDPAFDHIYKPKLLETPATPLKRPFSTPVLHRQIETPAIGQQQIFPSILENELFLDTMLKKPHYASFRKENIIELQKTVEGNLEL